MQIPSLLLTIGIWAAYLGVVAGLIYLIVILLRDWKNRELW